MADANEPQPAAPGDVKQEGGDAPIGPTAHTGGDGPQPVEPPDMLHIRLDRQDIEVPPADLHDGELTGKEIRELATPPVGADRDIFEIVPGGSDQKIGDEDTVAIRDHIRFFSAPRNINPGTAAPSVSRRHPRQRSFHHAANDDQTYLAQEFPAFAQRAEGGMLCVVLPNYLLPAGLVPNQADLLLRLSPNYPDVPPDMWWFHPALIRVDGGAIPSADVTEHHLGKPWQRWSRHLNANQWRPGADSLRTYLAILNRDLTRAAG